MTSPRHTQTLQYALHYWPVHQLTLKGYVKTYTFLQAYSVFLIVLSTDELCQGSPSSMTRMYSLLYYNLKGYFHPQKNAKGYTFFVSVLFLN